ncbi:MAG: disulfide bond formation protein B [Candidatus Taylorbacteria bacterium CG11_big_fil_rev_8_21_14_0_20_46_11]|uniref:Disulfide bond formation protein B n=1 Tax=Candidatus Taylorbacteria bacterium CG11_big_fil_rev_8_21_14_0_20_46_11 TaxID=1975025 RepID=A0A2H0KAF1_9BACT|nr:MAG: disulfide bond formation protein B [Candidatus Taylorbacteria bacterium CG11_big_fil_rev_8_21_14_0_20_46_11]
MTLATSVNFILSSLTVLAQILVIWLVLSWLFSWPLPKVLRSRATLLAFIVATIATLGSLTYSDILGYEPCKLCWFQRIFMYPQVLILGFAVFGKHKGSRALFDVSFVMAIVGAVIAFYHYLMQNGIVPEGSCAAIGYSASCAQRFVMNFDYITIPLMATSAFLLIIVALRISKKDV